MSSQFGRFDEGVLRLCTRGVSASIRRRSVCSVGEDAARQYSSRPAEVRAAILRNNPVPRAVPAGQQVSLRVCEMEAEVRVYLRDLSVPAEEVAAELQRVLVEKASQGVIVAGLLKRKTPA